ncbi:sigma-54-dependent Fis family transcriptional regulator [Halalkalibacillus halophilus]|uniref:sigma-54-dependent Fis family transcriptional regulator n=1 Tax=Halalkalibacillus halophilus TaxID=392827 RepID=UPI000426F201|nr:sigma-54-dependent Fis family transcriptional regulator [Halalkalibacillus halophilus]
MQKVLIVGAGNGGTAILKLFQQMDMIKVLAVADINEQATGIHYAKNNNIKTYHSYIDGLQEDVDIIVETTGREDVFQDIKKHKTRKSVVIPGTVAHIIYDLMNEKEILLDQLKKEKSSKELLLDSIHDGMIVIDSNGIVTYSNPASEAITNIEQQKMINQPIESIIPDSKLPEILKTKKKELNQSLKLENGKQIISTRIPLISEQKEVLGAFAVFKDITEVVSLAEEITDLKNIQTMLEAIIQSSEEAISVVDEEGKGMMFNPAYTNITGLSESEVLGKHASADISEGKSMHMEVLHTKKAVRGARMKVGPSNREVLVNAAPVIVDQQLKGSVAIIHDLTEIENLTSELKQARQIIRNLEAKYTFDDVIADSLDMKVTLEQAKVAANTPVNVLLRGESGTGKELIAHSIHNESDRRHHKFIRVNCASMDEASLEKLLFGDALGPPKKQQGIFEEANHGSVFIDEIGELSLDLQARLLHVLEHDEIVRVGGSEAIPVDVRIIAATNVNLERAMMEKEFKEDLFFRLNRLPITIAPLRERKEDIKPLAERFLLRLNQNYSRNIKIITDEAIEKLKKYNFPGNARELENILGRTMIYMDSLAEVLDHQHLPTLKKHSIAEIHQLEGYLEEEQIPLQEAMDEFEKQLIMETLEKNNYIKSKTAKQLHISIRNLYYKMEKHNLGKDIPG